MGFWNDEILNEAETSGGFEPIPAGEYTLMLTDAEVKPTKSGGHQMLMKFEVTGPECIGKKVFDRVNVNNSNAKAVSIGLGHIKEFATACGNIKWYENLKEVGSWDEAKAYLNGIFEALGNTEVAGKVIIKTSEGYNPQNEIKGFKAVEQKQVAATKKGGKGSANPWE
jgi:hypothetical protein